MKKERTITIIGVIFTIVILILVVSVPWQLLLLLAVAFTIFYYFSSPPDTKNKIRIYVVIFCVVCILTFMISYIPIFKIRSHLGSQYHENVSRIDNGGLYPFDDDFNHKEFVIPSTNYFSIKTDFFDEIDFDIKFTLDNIKKSEIDEISVEFMYYYDSDMDNVHNIKESIKMEITDKDNDCKGELNLSYDPDHSSHKLVNYLIRFIIIFKEDHGSFNFEIIFKTNIDDNNDYFINYSYIKAAYLGDFSNINFLVSSQYLLLAAGVIIISFLFAIVICFVLKKLEVLSFLSFLWMTTCVLLLFYHIAFAIENPSQIGLPSFFDDDWLVVDSLKNIMIFIISIIQWSFTIGLALLIVLISTKAFTGIMAITKAAEEVI